MVTARCDGVCVTNQRVSAARLLFLPGIGLSCWLALMLTALVLTALVLMALVLMALARPIGIGLWFAAIQRFLSGHESASKTLATI